MTVSRLAKGCIWSPNYTEGRWNVTRLTPHHTAMIGTAEQIAAVFKPTSRNASCNYAIGVDGGIVCVVDEDNRSWCTSSYDNDMQAITFELSDCDYDWNISDATLDSFIDLCVDLIKRYPSLGGSYDWTGDMGGNVTAHRWFSATACPGDPLYDLQDWIEAEVNRRLRGEDDDEVRPEDITAIVNAIAFKGDPFNSEGMYYKGHIASKGWDGAFVRDGQAIGTEGQALRLEAIWFIPPKDIDLKVSAYLADKGWVDYDIPVTGGVVGTEGEARAMEAIRLDASVPIKYRCHVSNIGWQEWKSNGEVAGAEGQRIEAFQLVLA